MPVNNALSRRRLRRVIKAGQTVIAAIAWYGPEGGSHDVVVNAAWRQGRVRWVQVMNPDPVSYMHWRHSFKYWLDNVFIERLWRSVKYEEVYLKANDNLTEAREGLAAYFDFYNQRRRHQGLEGSTLDEVYWSTLRRQATAA